MSPVYPPPSLHSLSATGKLGDEYPYQQNIGRRLPDGRFHTAEHFTIGRHATLIKRPTSSFTNCTAGALAIQAMWNGLDDFHRNLWTGHAKRWRMPNRIAFRKYNMIRIVNHLPIVDHPPD